MVNSQEKTMWEGIDLSVQEQYCAEQSRPYLDYELKATLFGPLRLENRYGSVMEDPHHPTTAWRFLKYLLINQGRETAVTEIMENVWPGKENITQASASSLRVHLSRLRKNLEPIYLGGKKGLVYFSSGFFGINPDISIQTDETHIREILDRLSTIPPEDPEGMVLCREVLELFCANFLSNTEDVPWLEPYQKYYADRFCQLAKSTLDRMKALHDTSLLTLLTQRLTVIAPDKEEVRNKISQLIEENQQRQHNPIIFTFPPNTDSELNEKTIRIRLFGLLKLENQFGQVSEERNSTSKGWQMLQYLIANYGREVPRNEMEEAVWGGKAEDTAVSATLHRLRSNLEPLHPGSVTGLVCYRGGFFWLNHEYALQTDEAVVRSILAQIADLPPDSQEGLRLCKEALKQYNGRFLETTKDAPWVIPYRKHCADMFLQLANNSLDRMNTLREYSLLPLLGQRAVELLPDGEQLHREIIRLMAEHNQTDALIRHISRLTGCINTDVPWLHTSKDENGSEYGQIEPEYAENNVRIRLFGLLEFENRWGRVGEYGGTPALRWLPFKYLLAHPGSTVSEDELRKLWPEEAADSTDAAFEVRRSRVRTVLAPLHLKNLCLYSGVYRLNPDYNLMTDTVILERLMKQLQSTPDGAQEGLELCSQALMLFRGPFLDHTKETDWLVQRRSEYDRVFDSLVHTTIARMKALEDDHTASLLWRRAIAYIPQSRTLHMEIIRFLIERKRLDDLIPYIVELNKLANTKTEWLNPIVQG